MPEYIDKDELLNDIECINISDCTDIDDIFIEVERTIDEQPAADVVEVRHGKWNKNGNGRDCSICGFKYYANGGLFNFCPNCGARMDGDTE